jgi:hypothetical protein
MAITGMRGHDVFIRPATGGNQMVPASFASWRLGEKLKNLVMTENAIAKEIVDASFRMEDVRGIVEKEATHPEP